MHLLGALLAADPTPMPTPTMTVPAESVTPGFPGFIVIVVIVVALALLVVDMLRRIRRTRYRAEVNEQLDQEEAAAARADVAASGQSDVGTEEPPAR